MGLFTKYINRKEVQNPEEAALLNYVAGLTPNDIDKLLDIAKNQFNSADPNTSKSMTEYYDLIQSVFRSTNFNSIGNTPQTRNQRYEIYDEMDESTAYISSALDILSDDATQTDSDGVILHITSESSKIVNLVEEFIEEFELEDKLSKWARATAKYGDLFVKVEGEFGKGITYINDTIYPGIIDRRDLNGKLLAFVNNKGNVSNNDELYPPWEFVHFRHKGDIYKEESNYATLGIAKDVFDKNLTSAYGQSILRPAIKVYAQLRFVENMILLSRLTNSIRRNIFLINVGEVAPDKAYEAIANYASLLKKDINLNVEENVYSASKHTIKYDEDIFLPVGDPQNDVRIEQIGGDVNIEEQYDLEYYLNKLFAALKIPKAYLNYEQDLNARSTLIQLDIRYARSVSQLQHTMLSGVRRLINIHLAYLGLDPDELDLEINLTTVSAIDEESRVEQLQNKLNVARDTWDLLQSMSDVSEQPLNLKVAAEHIMSTQLELDQPLIDEIFNRSHQEDSPQTKIYSGRRYSGYDLHAMYPSQKNQVEYERIRENIKSIPSVEEQKDEDI